MTAHVTDNSRNEDSFGPAKTGDNRKYPEHAKGRILRVKQGYNPNSSSMGSIVFALPAALLGITTAFGAVSGIIMTAFMRDKSPSDKKKEPDYALTPEQIAELEG